MTWQRAKVEAYTGLGVTGRDSDPGSLRCDRCATRRWRMLSTIPGATADAVLYAEEQGWIELERGSQRELRHGPCLF